MIFVYLIINLVGFLAGLLAIVYLRDEQINQGNRIGVIVVGMMVMSLGGIGVLNEVNKVQNDVEDGVVLEEKIKI